MTFRKFIEQYAPPTAMLEWLGDKSLKDAWATCPRVDWMLNWMSRGTITPAVTRLDLITLLASVGRETDVPLTVPESRMAMYLTNAKRGQDIRPEMAHDLLIEGHSAFIACVRNMLTCGAVEQQNLCKWASLAAQALTPDTAYTLNLGHLVRWKFPQPPRFRGPSIQESVKYERTDATIKFLENLITRWTLTRKNMLAHVESFKQSGHHEMAECVKIRVETVEMVLDSFKEMVPALVELRDKSDPLKT